MSALTSHIIEHCNYALDEFFQLRKAEFIQAAKDEPSFIEMSYEEIWEQFIEVCMNREVVPPPKKDVQNERRTSEP